MGFTNIDKPNNLTNQQGVILKVLNPERRFTFYLSCTPEEKKWYIVAKNGSDEYSRREIKREDVNELKYLASQRPIVRFQSPLYKFVGLYLRHIGVLPDESSNKIALKVESSNDIALKLIKDYLQIDDADAENYQLSNIGEFLKNVSSTYFTGEVGVAYLEELSKTQVPERLADLPQFMTYKSNSGNRRGLVEERKKGINEIMNKYAPNLLTDGEITDDQMLFLKSLPHRMNESESANKNNCPLSGQKTGIPKKKSFIRFWS